MPEKLIIIGSSATAETIYKFIKFYDLFNVIGFAVNKEYKKNDTFLGMPLFNVEDIDIVFDKSEVFLFVAIQWNNLNRDRKDVYETLCKKGYKFANIISPTAVIHSVIQGANCWISDHAVIDSDVKIGNNVFIKVKASVAHYTVIEDHCFIGASSFIAGSCVIGEQSFVGLGAIVLDKVIIGKKCLVGAGTFVNRNVESFTNVKRTFGYQEIYTYDESTIESKLVDKRNIR